MPPEVHTHAYSFEVESRLIQIQDLYREQTWLTAPTFWDSRPSFKKESISENKDITVWVDKYLSIGEYVLDTSVALAGSSAWFERKR
jgi:hypothetical protein